MLAHADAIVLILAALVVGIVGNGRPKVVQRDILHLAALAVAVLAAIFAVTD